MNKGDKKDSFVKFEKPKFSNANPILVKKTTCTLTHHHGLMELHEERILACGLVTCNVASILWIYLKLRTISMVAINHTKLTITHGCPQHNNFSSVRSK